METTADRLRRARIAAGFATIRDAAAFMGLAPSTYAQHENGSRGLPAKKAAQYARAFRVTPEYLLFGDGRSSQTTEFATVSRRVPVVGEVAAGVWLDVSPREMSEVHEFLDTALRRRFFLR